MASDWRRLIEENCPAGPVSVRYISPPIRRYDVTDTLPDRLCVDPSSRYYDEQLLARNIGIRFNGVERTNVEEYCISEGWIRCAVGKTLDRRGRPLTVQLKGNVEPFFKE
jgi:hypothetical protein